MSSFFIIHLLFIFNTYAQIRQTIWESQLTTSTLTGWLQDFTGGGSGGIVTSNSNCPSFPSTCYAHEQAAKLYRYDSFMGFHSAQLSFTVKSSVLETGEYCEVFYIVGHQSTEWTDWTEIVQLQPGSNVQGGWFWLNGADNQTIVGLAVSVTGADGKYCYWNNIKVTGIPYTSAPTPIPTENPTPNPTAIPTNYPTPNPTHNPTQNPTMNPSKTPTKAPSNIPSISPTKQPTDNPVLSPTTGPTITPSYLPTITPTPDPTENDQSVTEANIIRSTNNESNNDVSGVAGSDGAIYIIIGIIVAIGICCVLIFVFVYLRKKKKKTSISDNKNANDVDRNISDFIVAADIKIQEGNVSSGDPNVLAIEMNVNDTPPQDNNDGIMNPDSATNRINTSSDDMDDSDVNYITPNGNNHIGSIGSIGNINNIPILNDNNGQYITQNGDNNSNNLEDDTFEIMSNNHIQSNIGLINDDNQNEGDKLIYDNDNDITNQIDNEFGNSNQGINVTSGYDPADDVDDFVINGNDTEGTGDNDNDDDHDVSRLYTKK